MRGYRYLKVSNQLGRITAVKEALTNTKLNQCERRASKLIFGAGHRNAELIIRQYLLTRVGGLSLNQALLCALGKPGSDVVHPLPPEWRTVVEQHGFKVARIRSALAWYGYVVLLLVYGMASIALQLAGSVKEIIRPTFRRIGKFAYFNELTAGNLPQPCKDGRSHDIITWYQQWPGRVNELDTICHGVKGVTYRAVDGVPLVTTLSAIPPLTKVKALVRFVGWGVASSTLAIFDLFRGRWWHALLLREASSAAVVRIHEANKLARDYLFNNSSWTYRSLWTYEAEKQGSQITFYFYSTNNEDFKRPDGYPPVLFGGQAMNWSRYLVWDEYQADFVSRAVGESANISVVGPIWFHTSGNEMRELPHKAVAVFDVQPMRSSFYKTLGINFDYYTPEIANQFLSDIYETLLECNGTLILKQKRKLGKLAHPKYRQFVEKFDGRSNFFAVDPDTSALRLIEECVAVISMPFTSTALLGRWLGKPSVYYDPSGLIQKDDRAAHGIEILCGVEKLREWMASAMKLGLDE
jgi:polysaccharide biosynthesis PFTS motif protein